MMKLIKNNNLLFATCVALSSILGGCNECLQGVVPNNNKVTIETSKYKIIRDEIAFITIKQTEADDEIKLREVCLKWTDGFVRADGKPLPDTLAMEGHEEAIEYNKEYVISVKAANTTQHGTENKTLKLTVGDEEEADKFASQTYVVTWEYTPPGEGADLEQAQKDLAQAQADLAQTQAEAQALLEEVLNWTAQADPAQAAEGTPGAPADLTQVRAELAKAKQEAAQAKQVIQKILDDFLCCSISQEVFEDPVVFGDGRTYSRAWIEQYFATSHRRISPITREPLGYRDPLPNLLAKQLIDFLREKGYTHQ